MRQRIFLSLLGALLLFPLFAQGADPNPSWGQCDTIPLETLEKKQSKIGRSFQIDCVMGLVDLERFSDLESDSSFSELQTLLRGSPRTISIRNQSLSAAIRSLVNRRVMKILMEPTIVITSDRPASTFTGGEIEIPSSIGEIKQTPFGTKLLATVRPLSPSSVQLQVTAESSSVRQGTFPVVDGFRMVLDEDVPVSGTLLRTEEARSSDGTSSRLLLMVTVTPIAGTTD